MAVTLLQVVQRISRKIGLSPSVSAFSDDDETNDIVQDINEAYEELIRKLPNSVPFFSDTGTISTVNGTRLYSLDSDASNISLYDWGFEDDTNGDARIYLKSLEEILKLDTRYDEQTGRPQYVYRDGSQLGVYPIPDGSYTIRYKYASIPTRLSSTSATFLVPDSWVAFIERRAQAEYEKRKGFGSYAITEGQAYAILEDIIVEAWEMVPGGLVSGGWDNA